MELKRDEILKWWELCANDITCRKCPYEEVGNCQGELMQATLDIFKELTAENKLLNVELGNANSEILRLLDEKKELTEENERLHTSCTEFTRKLECANLEIECKERICESYMLQYGTVADKEVWLKKEREATIQKYREALYRAFAHFDSNDKFNKKVFLEVVDQIAKEMLEGVCAEEH